MPDTFDQVVKVAKIGKSVYSNDPNDFIFHSSYNTFKIVLEATKTGTLAATTNNQTISVAHGQPFIPLVAAFAKLDGENQVFLPNGLDVTLWGPKLGMTGDVTFNYISADNTNVYFNFDNTDVSIGISIRYFLLEAI